MSQKEPHDVIAESDDFDRRLNNRLKAMAAEDIGMDWLVTTGRRNRKGIRRTAIVVGVDIALTLAVTVIGFGVIDANNNAHQARLSNYNSCIAGNQNRLDDKDFWENKILPLIVPPNSDHDPKVVAFKRGLEAAVNQKDALRRCIKP